MVEFSRYLETTMHRPWCHAYIRYNELKAQLDLIEQFLTESAAKQESSLLWLKLLFQRALDGEISKILDFYQTVSDSLRNTIDDLQEGKKHIVLNVLNQREVSMGVKLHVVHQHLEAWREAGHTLSNLLMFVALNMRALRKIVKKQHKLVGALEPGSNVDLKAALVIQHPHEDVTYKQGSFLSQADVRRLEAMAAHEDLLDMQSLVQARLEQLLSVQRRLKNTRSLTLTRSQLRHPSTSPSAVGPAPSSPGAQTESSMDVETGARVAESRAFAKAMTMRISSEAASSRRSTTLKRWDSFGSFESNVSVWDSVLDEMAHAGVEAARQARLITPMETMMATRIGLFEEAPAVSRATSLGLLLNLANVFLYMANYNLVIPFADSFCDHLGASRSVGGIVIGCADIMAIVVSVGYSIWTNYSFKQPLVFSSMLCLAGNLLVTLAYDTGGLPLLLAGRLLTGTGAARALNRRYIADFVSLEDRTTASIGFVAASAAGMALGPFAAVPLTAAFEGRSDSLRFMGLTINAITMSGWLMVAVWAVFWLVALLFFEEPLKGDADVHTFNRADLDEDGVAVPLLPPGSEVPGATAPPQSAFHALHPKAPSAADGFVETVAPTAEISVPPHPDANASPGGGVGAGEVAAAGVRAGAGAGPRVEECETGQEGTGEEDEKAIRGVVRTISRLPVSSFGPQGVVPAGVPLPARPGSRLAAWLQDPHLLPTVACTVFLFLLKLLQQGTVSSAPLLSEAFYGWQESTVGWFMAGMSLAMLPVNFSVAALTAVVSDRAMMGISIAFCILGCGAMVSISGQPISLPVYLVGFTLVLSFTNILEGVSMSVLSKVIHPGLAKGTFNAGLLSTQSGSTGRLVGNFSIAFFGSVVVSVVSLANLMYGAFAGIAMMCAVLFVFSYSKLQDQ